MLYKLIDRYNIISSASQNKTSDGRPVSNFTAWMESKPKDFQIANGWMELDLSALHPYDADIESGVEPDMSKNYRQVYEIVDNVIVMSWEEYEVPIQAFNMLKTLLRENMRAAGMEQILDDYLASNPEAKKKWEECIVLESNSSFIVDAIAMIVGAGIKTEAEMREIMEKSRTTLTV